MEGKTVRNDRYGEYRNSRRNRKCGVRNGRKHRKFTAALFRVAVVLCFLLFVYGGVDYYQNRNLDRTFELLGQVGETARAVPAKVRELAWRAENAVRGLSGRQTPSFPLDEIPEYSGEPYVVVDGNVPGFTDEERASGVYEYYSDLDFLGRCGAAQAMLGPQLMPDEERGEISEVHPSGWHTARYDFIENGYLYNRCHLIAYAMTGENANEKNLITGTPKASAAAMLVRAMNPQVVAMDEIGGREDAAALLAAAGCGAMLLASAHGRRGEPLPRACRDLLDQGVFRRIVWIRADAGGRSCAVERAPCA